MPIYTNLKITDSFDIRRYFAILFMAGGAIAMTGMLAWIVYLLSAQAVYLFWIAVGLLILIGLMQSGFVALLAKRSIVVSKDKIEIVDKDAKVVSK